MKRIPSFLLACLLLCTCIPLLSGCHGSQNRSEFVSPASFDVSKEYAITFWAKNDTNKNQTKIYQQAIQDFEKIYPNITVNIRLYTDYAKIYNDVITNISTNTTPNVCITYPDHIATYLSGQSVVVPLDDLMDNEQYGLGGSQVRFTAPTKDQIIPQFFEEGKIGEYTYALPFMRSTEACYINRDFVEKLGYTIPETLTWDFIWEVSEAALAKDENGLFLLNGQKVLIPFIYKSTDNMMIQMLEQANAGYSNPNGDIEIFNDTTRSILYDIGKYAGSGAFSTFKISSYPANFLNAGQCIFAIDSTAGSTWMGSNAPLMDIPKENIVKFDTVVMEVPQFDPSNPRMISQGPSVCVFNKQDPQEVLASWLFTQYLLTDGVQSAYAQTEGYSPVTITAQQSEEYQDYLSRSGEDNEVHYSVKIDATRLLMDNTANTFTTPVFNGSTSLRSAAGQMIENVAKFVRRKGEVSEEYLDGLFDEMTTLFHLDECTGSDTLNSGKQDLGPLPQTSVILLAALVLSWCIMLVWVILQKVREKKVSGR